MPEADETTPAPQPARRFPDRVADRAATLSVVRVLLVLLAVPFYLVGALVGLLWMALRWVIAAGQTGFFDARDRARQDTA